MRALCLVLTVLAPLALADTTLLYNIRGYTMNEGERIDFVGLEYDGGTVQRLHHNEESVTSSGADVRIDGNGATVLPGLIDAHGHVSNFGLKLASVDLVGTQSEQDAAERVAAFTVDPDKQWIRGRGWNQVLWAEKAFPSRHTLDALELGRPIALSRIDGHALWVNSEALELAGIDRETPDPDGGQILRDSSGEPTGVLIDNAMSAVKAAIGSAADEEVESNVLRGLNAAAATGLTAVHDAGIDAQTLSVYQNLQTDGRLPIRVYPMLSVRDPANDSTLAAGPTTSDDGMLVVRSVKISADGALGSRGAALQADYSDDPGNRGLLLFSDDELRRHIRRSANAGFQVNVHAIGDLANRRVLEEFAQLKPPVNAHRLRHRIEHAQIIDPADLARFAELGVIASVQPTHATSDKNMAGDRLGEARLEGAYAWRTLLEKGASLAGGSDFPVEPADPLFGLHAAVTRTDRNGEPLGGWRPMEKLTREQALSLFTEWAAYAGHDESTLGRLLPGYAADFVVLEQDYFTQPEQDIWRNRVLATVVRGNVVFAAGDSPLH